MTSNSDILNKITNAVLDLQSSNNTTFERPLRNLVRLLKDPILAEVNQKITFDVDVEEFIKTSLNTRGLGFGANRLVWPDAPEKQLGISYLLICKFGDDPEFMLTFGINFYSNGNHISATIQNLIRGLIMPFERDYKEYVKNNGFVENKINIRISNKVFVVHGHDDGARESVARFLEKMDLKPIILHEQANQGRTVIEKVEANGDVGFAVVLLTPDDEGRAKGEPSLEPRARQNVLLELGYFIGRLGRNRVCALKRGNVEIPSDFAGMVWVEMDNGNGWKLPLANELKSAGHHIDLNKVLAGS